MKKESFIGNEVFPYLMDARDEGVDISTKAKALAHLKPMALVDEYARPVVDYLQDISDEEYGDIYKMLMEESKVKESVFDFLKKKKEPEPSKPLKFSPIKKHGSVNRLGYKPKESVQEQVTIMKPAPVDDKISDQFREWRERKQQFAVLQLLAGKIAARLDEIEKDIKGIVKEVHGQQVNIDDAIAEYKTRKTTSTAYKTVMEKALAIMNADQAKILTDFKESITKKGTSEAVKITDPKLEALLNTLNNTPLEELMQRAREIQDIPDLPPLLPKGKPPEESMASKIAGNLIQKIKDGFKSVFDALSKGKQSAMNLMRIAQGNESLTKVERLLGNLYEVFETDESYGKKNEANTLMIQMALKHGFTDEGEDTETGWHSFYHSTHGLYLDVGPSDEWKLQASSRYGSSPIGEGHGAKELEDFLVKEMR